MARNSTTSRLPSGTYFDRKSARWIYMYACMYVYVYIVENSDGDDDNDNR